MTLPTVAGAVTALALSPVVSVDGGVGPPASLVQAGTVSVTGGLSAFLGVTALVLTGFLVLARLSQRVVDDAEEAGSSERARVPASPGPAPGEPTVSDDRDGQGRPERPGTTGRDATDAVTTGTHTPGGPRARVDEVGPSRADDTRSPSAGVDQSSPVSDEGSDGIGVATAPDATQSGTAGGDGMASIPAGALLANVALTQGLFGGVLAAAAWFFQVPAPVLGLAGGPVDGVAAVAVGLAFGVALWVGNEAASALADATGAGYDEGLRQLLAPADARGWAVLLGGVLPVVALVEEFIFRAAAVGAASAALGGTPAAAWALAVGSSLAFALGHGAQGRVGVVVTGALGFVLAAGFLLSGSFVVVVVAHYVVNALEFLLHEAAGLPDPVWA